ncbi:alanine racemase, partial [Klebsiella oxytoca]
GYDGAFTAQRPSRLALVTIGYADGWPRSLSRGRGRVLVRGQSAPIAGLICMDQLLADVTGIAGVSPGD